MSRQEPPEVGLARGAFEQFEEDFAGFGGHLGSAFESPKGELIRTKRAQLKKGECRMSQHGRSIAGPERVASTAFDWFERFRALIFP